MKIAALPSNEVQRLMALREYSVLDTGSEKEFDEIVALASFICDTPISTVTLIDETRQWFKAKKGLTDSETSRNVAFCAHAIHQNDIMIVNDATKDERFFDNPLVTGKPDIRFYAGMPLITPDGYNLGTICVIDTKPKKLSEEQNFALRVLGSQVMKLLELRKKNIELLRIHDMHNRLLSIIGHDLRSPVNSIDGLLLLAERYDLSVNEYAELIPKMRQMVDSANNLLLNLLHWAKNHVEGVSPVIEEINIRKISVELVTSNSQLFDSKKNKVVIEVEDMHRVKSEGNKVEFIFRNIVLNANKYTSEGTITLRSKKSRDGMIEICVTDTGTGMEESVREKIFEWGKNKSTEGTGGERGSGLGLPMCKEFIEQQKGTIWVESMPGKGTSIFFTLPGRQEN